MKAVENVRIKSKNKRDTYLITEDFAEHRQNKNKADVPHDDVTTFEVVMTCLDQVGSLGCFQDG